MLLKVASRARPAVLAALAVALSGCIDDPVTHEDQNLLVSELELIWRTFDQEYVGFSLADPDWDRCWSQASSSMDTVITARGLGNVIWQMLEPLQDPSVSLQGYAHNEWLTESAYPYTETNPANYDSALMQQYLLEYDYQQMQPSWGYCMLADSTVPLFVVTNWSGFGWGFFDEHFYPLLDSPGMIVDIRDAPNVPWSMGTAAMPKLMANRFADELRPGFFRCRRDGPGRHDLTAPHACLLHPRQGFTGPTLVLIGPQNNHVSERFASMMGSLPHSQLAGDTTAGRTDGSTAWATGNGTVTVPDTAILAWDSTRIQRAGVAPDIRIPADSEDFVAGVDPVLDYAIDWAESL